MILKLRDCPPRKTAGLGATLAEQHMCSMYKAVADGTLSPDSLVVMDFDGFTSVNGSYIKATVFWLFTCGRLSTTNPGSTITPRHPADPRPYDVYTCVTGLTPETIAEFQEFLVPRRIPILLGKRMKDEAIQEAVLLGHLDPTLSSTLEALQTQGKATAPTLHELKKKDDVTVTAWNNRLNDLHSLRLVRRSRAGRAWEYESLAQKILWE